MRESIGFGLQTASPWLVRSASSSPTVVVIRPADLIVVNGVGVVLDVIGVLAEIELELQQAFDRLCGRLEKARIATNQRSARMTSSGTRVRAGGPPSMPPPPLYA
jgi:hypothetical protein